MESSPRTPRRALITGITGQDGSYLAELLLEQGYDVHGLVRRTSILNTDRIEHLKDRIGLIEADLTDQGSIIAVVSDLRPTEIYNLAAQSFVPTSWRQPILTGDVTALGATRVLEAIRIVDPTIRMYQASSSEMFGQVQQMPQTEQTPFYPRSPYAVSKLYAHWITINYRESFGLFCVSGILFNHESPRRGPEFVTRKISRHVAMIKLGLAKELRLGNLDARRDWGHARDYVRAMWLMLQQPEPQDFVISSGENHSVREFCEAAFECAGLDWERYVVVDPALLRPAEVNVLLGDSSLARAKLGWVPEVGFRQLVQQMVQADLAQLERTAESFRT